MIIEATQTFSPGNVELLIYLLKKLDSRNVSTKVFVGHQKTFNLLKALNLNNIVILKSSALNSFLRSLKIRSNVIFFCSYPPLAKHLNSIVYYHSTFFTNSKNILKNKKISTNIKFKRLFVHFLIKFFHQNVDSFYCQTNQIEADLKANFNKIRVKKMPFYNDLDLIGLNHQYITDFDYDFFYPATPDIHKNYFRLFEAVRILGREKKIKVCVTIDKKSVEYVEKMNEINDDLKFEAIINVGRVSKADVLNLYMKSKAMVFPSLEESLGLPLIEAAYISCPIVGSDLPYIYDVVENPIVFDPLNVKDIADKMNDFLEGKFGKINQRNKIENKIDEILDYLVN